MRRDYSTNVRGFGTGSSPPAVARLRELIEPESAGTPSLEAPAYTVASLAVTLGVSARVIRGAIGRGELDATKRGARWIISAGCHAVGRGHRGEAVQRRVASTAAEASLAQRGYGALGSGAEF